VRFSENLLYGDSEVFGNPDHYEWIIYLTCMILRLIIAHFYSFLSYLIVSTTYNITNKNFVKTLF
jgi:hypothetical protein